MPSPQVIDSAFGEIYLRQAPDLGDFCGSERRPGDHPERSQNRIEPTVDECGSNLWCDKTGIRSTTLVDGWTLARRKDVPSPDRWDRWWKNITRVSESMMCRWSMVYDVS